MAQNASEFDPEQDATKNAAVAAALRKAATNLSVSPAGLDSDTSNKVAYDAGTKELERSPLTGDEFHAADTEFYQNVHAATYEDTLDTDDLKRIASEIDPL